MKPENVSHDDPMMSLFIIVSLVSYLVSVALAQWDSEMTYRWVSFGLHFLSVGAIVILYVVKTFFKKKREVRVEKKEWVGIGLLMGILLLTNFLFLSVYPYVSISDELRDGGVYPVRIVSGEIKNIFKYGAYEAHGLIIPSLISFLTPVLGGSVLMYRLVAAIFASLDVFILYLLVRKIAGTRAAFWSAVALATLPLHMFFARTQAVVGFNMLASTVLLLGLYILMKKKRYLDYIFLGCVIGFILGFHAAVRAEGLVCLLCIVGLELHRFIFRSWNREGAKRVILHIFILFVFCFVGFGPRILFSDTYTFFHTKRFIYKEVPQIKKEDPNVLLTNTKKLSTNYIRSLAGWVYEPTSFFYARKEPIFPAVLAAFFLLGLGYSIFIAKNPYLNVLMIILLLCAFTNSAITDSLNADHRMSPLFAIGCIFVGLGIGYVMGVFHQRWKVIVFSIFLTLYFMLQVTWFYVDHRANGNYPLRDYVAMHLYSFLRENGTIDTQKPIFVYMSHENAEYMSKNIAVSEQLEYFFPTSVVTVHGAENLNDYEVYVSQRKQPFEQGRTYFSEITDCSDIKEFSCPTGYTKKIFIYY